MNRNEFIQVLVNHGFDPKTVAFDDPLKEGYGIRKNYFRWEAYFRERGNEYFSLGFPTESDALNFLLNKIVNE